MPQLAVVNAAILVTMDSQRREIADCDLVVDDGAIVAIGVGASESLSVERRIDAEGCVVTPGLINTHHHLFQTLTRAVPAAQNASLFDWLRTLYPIWGRMTPDDIYASTRLGLAELALSGCTMSSDHLYLFPNGVRLDDSIAAAQTIGLRFHPTRGAMSLGESKGGLPPDALVEEESAILDDMLRVIDRWHDPAAGSMLQIGVAPCSPFSVSRELMRDAAALARDKNVRLHTHLAENDDDVRYSLERFGCRPGHYVESLGWLGSDVWHAHAVKLDEEEIGLFARSGSGVAHCPCSNGRLGSGTAPVTPMLAAGVPVGLGVDGSASNDSGHLLCEARQAMLMQRAAGGAQALDVRKSLELATLGGARLLGRSDCGSLEIGKQADLAIWDVSSLAFAGAWDPVAALVLCGPVAARDVLVGGVAAVRDGRLVGLDAADLICEANRRLSRLMT